MLDENLPTFFIKPSSDSEFQSTIYLGQSGRELQPEYTLRKPDPHLPASKNCYAVALYDSYNPEVLYAEILLKPEWTQPTLSAAEIRAQNGAPPPQVPIIPGGFLIHLYNPDQQVMVKQVAGSWNSSAYWEFEIPQQTFRMPSVSALDQSQSGPAAAETTTKVTFKWRRDGKLSKDITCTLAGKSTDGKKSKEPDITVAMFTHGKEVTIYQPNMHRVEVEDVKGLEVVLILSAVAIKDIFFNASRDMFNISTGPIDSGRKNSGGHLVTSGGKVPNGGKQSSSPPPLASGALPAQDIQMFPERMPRPYVAAAPAPERPSQAEIDAETRRLIAEYEAEEKARAHADKQEQKRIKKMLEAEEKERKRRDTEVEKETERLRKQYGVEPVPDSFRPSGVPQVHFTPPLPSRPLQAPQQPPGHQNYGRPPGGPQPGLSPYTPMPQSGFGPIPRPSSVPPPRFSNAPVEPGPFNSANLNTWWAGPQAAVAAVPPQKPSHKKKTSANGPSSSGFFGSRDDASRLLGIGIDGEGGRKKVAKKRSVYF